MSYELTAADKAFYIFEVSDLERLEDGQVIKKNKKIVKVKPKTYEHYKRLEAKQGRNVLFHGKAVEVLNDPSKKTATKSK